MWLFVFFDLPTETKPFDSQHIWCGWASQPQVCTADVKRCRSHIWNQQRHGPVRCRGDAAAEKTFASLCRIPNKDSGFCFWKDNDCGCWTPTCGRMRITMASLAKRIEEILVWKTKRYIPRWIVPRRTADGAETFPCKIRIAIAKCWQYDVVISDGRRIT